MPDVESEDDIKLRTGHKSLYIKTPKGKDKIPLEADAVIKEKKFKDGVLAILLKRKK